MRTFLMVRTFLFMIYNLRFMSCGRRETCELANLQSVPYLTHMYVHYKGDWGVWRCLAVNIYSPRALF